MAVILNPIGVLMASLFVGLMGSILIWMLRVPRPVTQEVAYARHALDIIRRILVPLRGEQRDLRSVELACRLAEEQKSEILLAYVIEVPLILPLGTPLKEDEERGREALSNAREIVRMHDLPVKEYLERDRNAVHALLRLIREEEVDLVVLGIRTFRGIRGEVLGRFASELIQHAPCEVIFDRPPPSPPPGPSP